MPGITLRSLTTIPFFIILTENHCKNTIKIAYYHSFFEKSNKNVGRMGNCAYLCGKNILFY